MSNVIILLLFIIKSVTSYDIRWSKEFEYFSERSRYPYSIRIREQSQQALIICFEELNDDKYGGLCESAQLDVDNEDMTFGSKTFFELENASVPHEIQIWAGGNEGWTPYFLLGYTNGPDRSEGPGKVTMGRYLDGGGIMYSSNRMTFNPYSNDQTHLIELQNNSYFIICASVGPRNQYDTACKIGRYATSTMDISLGSKVFNISKVGNIAGCMVKDGLISRKSQIRVLRDNIVIHKGQISSLKRFREEVSEVKSGFECGVMLDNYSDIKVGDIIETFEEVSTSRKL